MAREVDSCAKLSFEDIFREVFPYYLNCGMTYNQFYYGDPTLVIPYKKAKLLRDSELNAQCWLSGAYVYAAVAGVLGGKKYMESPIPLTQDEVESINDLNQINRNERLRNLRDKLKQQSKDRRA